MEGFRNVAKVFFVSVGEVSFLMNTECHLVPGLLTQKRLAAVRTAVKMNGKNFYWEFSQ